MRTRILAAAAVALSLATTACSGGSRPSPSPSASGSTSSVSASPPASASTSPAGNWIVQENARKGSTAWRLGSKAPDAVLTGYADAVSVTPGTKVTLKVRATTAYTVTAFRIGWYAGTGGRLVYTSPSQPAMAQPKPTTNSLLTVSAAAWKPSLTVDTTGWTPGSYLLKLATSTGAGHYVPLTVRTADNAGRLVLLAATSTYQAYNTWGGYSLYKGPTPSDPRASVVSYDRPYDQDGARFALGYEGPIVREAERLGLNLGYATSLDLDQRGAATLAGADGVVSPGHDEYWSVPMRTAVENARDAGTNLAFLGANAVYWRVRFEASGRRMVGYKFDARTADPVKGATNTGMWRWYRSEASLTGQQYECFPARGAFVVADPSFFLFAGAGASKGSSYPGLVGVEIDRAYPAGTSPASTQVVGHSPVQCAAVGKTFSDMTYYTTTSGAGVVDVGTMNWRSGVSHASAVPVGLTPASVKFATAVTDNLLTAMAAGPMGKSHPSRPNLASIKPAASTSTGTGGSDGD